MKKAKRTLSSFFEDKYMSKLVIISLLLLIMMISFFIALSTRINVIKEESERLLEIEKAIAEEKYAPKEDIPGKTSELENDNNYQNKKEIEKLLEDDKYLTIFELNDKGFATYANVKRADAILQKEIDDSNKQIANSKRDIDSSKEDIKTINDKIGHLNTGEGDLEERTSQIEEQLANMSFDDIRQDVIDTIFPVGSLYYSMDKNFDPNTTWGGTWEKLSEGYFVEATETEDKVATQIGAGLPNIIGTSSGNQDVGINGAFYKIRNNVKNSGSSTFAQIEGFDASKGETKLDGTLKSSSDYHVFGKSETVQPQAYFAYIWKRTS